MRTDQRELVSEAFRLVFEKLAFMFGEPAAKEELPQPASGCVQTEMSFRGAMNGTLALAVPAEMCTEIAANVLGMEPDDDLVAVQATDALKEVLNVTCGRVLTALAGDRPVFDMSVPVTSRLDDVGWTALLNEPETVGFLVDDNPVLLQLSLEGQRA